MRYFAARTWYEVREVAHALFGQEKVSRVLLADQSVTLENAGAIHCVVQGLTKWRVR